MKRIVLKRRPARNDLSDGGVRQRADGVVKTTKNLIFLSRFYQIKTLSQPPRTSVKRNTPPGKNVIHLIQSTALPEKVSKVYRKKL
jgi:hypothetical protein